MLERGTAGSVQGPVPELPVPLAAVQGLALQSTQVLKALGPGWGGCALPLVWLPSPSPWVSSPSQAPVLPGNTQLFPP